MKYEQVFVVEEARMPAWWNSLVWVVGTAVVGFVAIIGVFALLSWIVDRTVTAPDSVRTIRARVSDTVADLPPAYSKAEAPKGWKVLRSYGFTSEDVAQCKGRIVVDVYSPECTRLPPRFRGGPAGMRCPNKCEE